jgi:hypothetical protein
MKSRGAAQMMVRLYEVSEYVVQLTPHYPKFAPRSARNDPPEIYLPPQRSVHFNSQQCSSHNGAIKAPEKGIDASRSGYFEGHAGWNSSAS